MNSEKARQDTTGQVAGIPDHMLARLLFLAVLGVVSASCGGDAPEVDLGRAARLDQDLRIGSLDDADYALTYVGDLEVGPDGTMYVNQLMQQQVKVFDSTGSFVRNIGRMGAGPGEFQAPLFMGWIGDSLWVYDGPLQRLSMFNRSGDFIATVRYAEHADAAFLADGAIALRQLSLLGRREVALCRWFVGEERKDTIAVWNMVAGEGWNPFRDDPLWKVAPDGSYVLLIDRTVQPESPSGEFQVTKLNYNGDTVWSRSIEYTPQPLTDGTIEAVVGPVVRRVNERSGGRPQVSYAERVEEMYKPETVAPVTFVVAGYDRSVWIRREDAEGATVMWDVLDASGRFLRTVRVPSTTRLIRATQDVVWGVEEDEFDVPYVVRFRVVSTKARVFHPMGAEACRPVVPVGW